MNRLIIKLKKKKNTEKRNFELWNSYVQACSAEKAAEFLNSGRGILHLPYTPFS